jgi:molecular chaperone Hsp33
MAASNIPLDDFVAGFASPGLPVAGRVVRLGPGTLTPILNRHAYPDHLAELLGEALLLSILVGAGMKFEGRVLAQAEGDGPVSMLVGEYRKDGGVRAYARHEPERWEWLNKINKGERPHMPQLFGATGRFGLIIIHDRPSTPPYQGIVPLEKAGLAACARDYFARSEQIDTSLHLTVRRTDRGGWVGGGMMMQRVASDDTRGDTREGWLEAQALFNTLQAEELVDESLPTAGLLFRLFHESGVSMEPPQPLLDICTCSRERLIGTLQGMADDSLRELVEPDGTLGLDCQFCSRHFTIPIEDVTGSTS